MTKKIEIAETLQAFGKRPSQDQRECIELLVAYLNSEDGNDLFVINGRAGSGKTTIVSALIGRGINCTLSASTGRAAKILSSKTGRRAITLHSLVYKTKDVRGRPEFYSKENPSPTDTVFIVDEASMIQSEKDFKIKRGNGMLADLYSYVKKFNSNNKLILIGDPMQLPPVGEDRSIALSYKDLEEKFGIKCGQYTLKTNHRQKEGSGILNLAMALEKRMAEGGKTFNFKEFVDQKDVQWLTVPKLFEVYKGEFSTNGGGLRLSFITFENIRANDLNRDIRSEVYRFDPESDLAVDDRLIVVTNNYFYKNSDLGIRFLANGESCRVKKILGSVETLGGQETKYREDPFKFQNVLVEVENIYGRKKVIEVKLILNPLDSVDASLAEWDNARLNWACARRIQETSGGFSRFSLYSDPYYKALRVKYAYAMTVHKAQGGEWPVVFIDYDGWMQKSRDLKWITTAITRAQDKVYLVGKE